MIRRALIYLVLAVVTSTGILFAGISQAVAAPLCTTPPTPVAPKSGISGLFTTPPATPPAGDPFEDGTVAIHDVYGTSWKYSLYDLGCLPDPSGGDAVARFDTANASLLMDLAGTNVAFLSLLERLAKDHGLGWLSDWVGEASTAIRPVVLGGDTGGTLLFGLLPLALLVTAVWVAWLARQGSLSAIGQQCLVVGIAFVLAHWTLTAPEVATRTGDGLVRAAASVSGSAFNASLTDGVNRQALYRAWLAGHFGDPDSQAAETYGPRLYKAIHFSWAEWAEAENDPQRREEIATEKGTEFKEVASEVKEQYPDVYPFLTGTDARRSGSVVYAGGVAAVMSLAAILALVIILVSRFMMFALVVAAPIGSILGVLPNGGATLRAMWGLFAAALWNVIKFSLAAGLLATIMGRLMTVDPVSAVVWIVVVTILFFVLTKPFRSFKTMTPGMDPNRSYVKELLKFGAKVGVSAAAGGAAGAAVTTVASRPEEEPATPQAERTRPPIPTVRQLPDPPTVRAEVAGPSAPPADGVHRPQLGGGPNRWDGVAPAAPLPASPDPAQDQTLRLDKPIVVTPGQSQPVAEAAQFDQSKVVIQGHVVTDTGQYVPAHKSRTEALAEGRPKRDSGRQIELYVPRKSA